MHSFLDLEPIDPTSSPTFTAAFQHSTSHDDPHKSYGRIAAPKHSFLYFDLESKLPVPEPYDRAMISGRIALAGAGVSILFSAFCIISGIFIVFYRNIIGGVVLPSGPWRSYNFNTATKVFRGVLAILPAQNPNTSEILSLVLNLVVMACTESIGFVHSISLKSALASESRLRFNTNLRLVTAARGRSWADPNGTLFNIIMSMLLIISYVSSSIIFLSFFSRVTDHSPNRWWSTCIFAAPVIILGTALLMQAVIALAGVRSTKVLTWSSSAFDTAAALIHDGRLTRTSGRCMHSVFHLRSQFAGPQLPSERQPSPWQAHPSIKKIITVLWCLTVACTLWASITLGIWYTEYYDPSEPRISWMMIPNEQTILLGLINDVDPERGYPAYLWLTFLIAYTVLQGALTLGLHCSEVIVNVVRDEENWRMATSKIGIHPSRNPLVAVLRSWVGVVLLAAKPLLHWMFGLCFNYRGYVSPLGTSLIQIEVDMRPVQIVYLAVALFLLALALTFVARHHLHGPQPAAYGHLQTLANLIDEWSPTMWWGHKQDGMPIGHAGTSSHILPAVNMKTQYAGLSIEH